MEIGFVSKVILENVRTYYLIICLVHIRDQFEMIYKILMDMRKFHYFCYLIVVIFQIILTHEIR